MLVRSAGRRHQRRTSHLLAASFAQLNLPWLAPAQLRWNAANHATSAPSSASPNLHPRRSNPHRPSRPRAHVRTLATATDSYTTQIDSRLPPAPYSTGFRNAAADKAVPFDFSPPTEPSKFSHLSRPRRAPIVLETSALSPDAQLTYRRTLKGSAKQLFTHFITSLRVGRQDRAQSLAQRITDQCGPQSTEAVRAHEVLIDHLLESVVAEGRDSPRSSLLLNEMRRWFEVEIRSKSIQLTPKMLISMLRATIRALDGSRRERSIRRYVELSKSLGEDAMSDIIYSEEFDDNEHAILGRAIPEHMDMDMGMDLSVAEESVPAEYVDPAAEPPSPSAVLPQQVYIDMETLPRVLSTEQKGTGLEGVKKTLETFAKAPSLSADASQVARRELAEKRQRHLEASSVDVAITRWREADEQLRKIGIITSMQTRPMNALLWKWYKTLLPALEEELEHAKQALADPRAPQSERHAYGPYLELLPLPKVAANTILFTMARMNSGKDWQTDTHRQDVKIATLAVGLANSIEAEVIAEASSKKQRSKKAKPGQTSRHSASPSEAAMDPSTAATVPSSKGRKTKASKKALLAQLDWPLNTKVQLGAMLVSKLIETAQLPVTRLNPRTKQPVTQLQPAFMHRVKFERGRKQGVVTPNPALTQKLQSEPVGSLIAKRMPMVVEPKPWKGWSDGGYLHYTNPILRLPAGDNSGKDYFIAADDRQDLGKVYQGLNALGKVPWKVHHGVFKVQLEAWNSGESIANFAPLDPKMAIPEEPESAATDPVARRKWLDEVRRVKNERGGLHSKRCFQNFQMEVARTLLNETLYFPHNLDFRGRAYPIPPYLNHMGADNVRGLLVFAEGKELGENGLRWLKIHLATVAGHDKASMEERVQFTEAHLDEIYDSVRKPLDGERWWLKADDAWQTLAACFELTEALDSPDPTKFVSRLPVQQDGTCNGLQHYAALGGGKAGAQQVNLEPGDRPADVYSAVLHAVEEEVDADAKLGNPVAQKLRGRLTRKCVKQPVMTNVYGVTFFGARQQVAKQLEGLFPSGTHDDAVTINKMAHYVATKIFKSLGNMFAGAQAIQTWLGQCADRISTCLTPEQVEELRNQKKPQALKPKKKAKQDEAEIIENAETEDVKTTKKKKKPSNALMSDQQRLQTSKPLFRSTVVWTTPLRLPVVQPYRKVKAKAVPTSMQLINIQDPQAWDPVSKRKQLQAFPPNFIHSLDATHMLLSATQCSENGMTFASIHDSFWTHACDVNRMSEVLRDAFVAMHKDDIIGRLREEFEARYRGCMYLAAIGSQSPVGQKISQLRVQLKKDKVLLGNELALEVERLRLCNSEDPEERAKGEAMVTPGSIVSSEADEAATSVPVELAGQRLGEIPGTEPDVETTESDITASPLESDGEELDETESAEAASPEVEDQLVKAKKKAPQRKLYVWLPLTFPEVPKKGDFQVERLLQSRYFFH